MSSKVIQWFLKSICNSNYHNTGKNHLKNVLRDQFLYSLGYLWVSLEVSYILWVLMIILFLQPLSMDFLQVIFYFHRFCSMLASYFSYYQKQLQILQACTLYLRLMAVLSPVSSLCYHYYPRCCCDGKSILKPPQWEKSFFLHR